MKQKKYVEKENRSDSKILLCFSIRISTDLPPINTREVTGKPSGTRGRFMHTTFFNVAYSYIR
ncbi:MAG: hypothetical protein KAW12_07435 [Candidatus Aminicenantes bacterium]|nr:hypothetical protein [Candidatus Aminicenantes bacterium]